MTLPTHVLRALPAALPASLPAALPPVLLLTLLAGAAQDPDGDPDERAALEEEIGWPVTSGAAPGYVPDAACAECHEDLWESYRDVGMARSFYRLTPETEVEALGEVFHHEASGDFYVTERTEDGGYLQRRWREAPDGTRYAEHAGEIAWVMGSGSNARTYFARTPGGELFQLPVSWYARPPHWGMSPGYDRPDHDGFTREVQRRCMFCHNAYPDVPAGSDRYGEPARFPEELPEGIGCQRCHGPGAEHVARALDPDASDDDVRGSIVNPARLAPERREDVCYQCHLQPLSALENVVGRVGRAEYSFRPGERLPDYQVHFDVVEPRPTEARFEINHHPYRLRQSPCWLGSDGELSCLTCHDPHRKVAPAERAAHYRDACLGCHAVDACSLDEMTAASELEDVARDDCATCHMPRRRTEDVIEVAVTDHLIRRAPAPEDWLAPREEVDRLHFLGARRYFPGRELPDDVERLHQALFEARNSAAAGATRLAEVVEEQGATAFEPGLDLARARRLAGELADAARTYAELVERHPERAVAWRELGETRHALGREREAWPAFSRAVELDPDDPETRFAFARALASARPKRALRQLEQGLALRPDDAEALELEARLQVLENPDAAEAAARRAVAVDPTRPEGFLWLGYASAFQEEWPQAIRTWTRGVELAPDHARLREALTHALLLAPEDAVRDPELALVHARELTLLAPSSANALLYRAVAELLAGDAALALEYVARAEPEDGNPEVEAVIRALAHERLGDLEAARREWDSLGTVSRDASPLSRWAAEQQAATRAR